MCTAVANPTNGVSEKGKSRNSNSLRWPDWHFPTAKVAYTRERICGERKISNVKEKTIVQPDFAPNFPPNPSIYEVSPRSWQLTNKHCHHQPWHVYQLGSPGFHIFFLWAIDFPRWRAVLSEKRIALICQWFRSTSSPRHNSYCHPSPSNFCQNYRVFGVNALGTVFSTSSILDTVGHGTCRVSP